jgi:hypothetical protein
VPCSGVQWGSLFGMFLLSFAFVLVVHFFSQRSSGHIKGAQRALMHAALA